MLASLSIYYKLYAVCIQSMPVVPTTPSPPQLSLEWTLAQQQKDQPIFLVPQDNWIACLSRLLGQFVFKNPNAQGWRGEWALLGMTDLEILKNNIGKVKCSFSLNAITGTKRNTVYFILCTVTCGHKYTGWKIHLLAK